MTDRDTADAIEALAHRVRVRDQAIRDGEDVADAEVFAREYMAKLQGHGWRPTSARGPGWPARRSSSPADPEVRAASIAELKAACEEATTVIRGRENEGAA